MIKIIKDILPAFLVNILKNIFWPPSVEFKWAKKTQKRLSGKISKEVTITTEGEIYLKSDFGFDFLLNMNETHLKLDTFDDLNLKYLLDYLSERIPQEPIIFDVGAFMGGYSLAIGSRFPKSKIYSFEPVISSFVNLRKNIKRNRFEDRIISIQLAVSDKVNELIMTSKQATGNHILSENEKNLLTEKVPAIDLDTFIIRNGIKEVHFIKCDVEGHEMAVINGAKDLIMKYKPILYIEIVRKWTERYENSPEEIVNQLTGFGYKGYILTQNSLEEISKFADPFKEFENFLFIAEN